MRTQSDTRENILDSVLSCKKEKLSDKPQLTQIAARAGISVRTLNRYYPNKEDMFCLAYLRFLQKKYDDAVQHFENTDLSNLNAYEQLFTFFDMSTSFNKETSDEAILVAFAYIKCMQFGMKEPKTFKSLTQGGQTVIRKLLKNGQADHSIKAELDIETTIELIEAGFNGLMQKTAMANRQDVTESEKARLMSLYEEFTKILELYLG